MVVFPEHSGQYGGYGVAVAQELVELLVWVQLPVATQEKRSFSAKQMLGAFVSGVEARLRYFWSLRTKISNWGTAPVRRNSQ